MSREELLELAGPDALGLLDEYEAALYTRSFHYAPAALQDEILNLQAEVASDASLLPTEEPEPGLRQRVLGAVARAIEQETRELAPLATIGRVRGDSDELHGRRHLNQATYWRAASFALAAGALVCLYFLAQVSQKSQDIARLALGHQTSRQLEEMLGPGFRTFVSYPSRGLRALAPETGDPVPSGAGAIFIDPTGDRAFLVVFGLDGSGEPYAIRVRDEQGETVLAHFGAESSAAIPVPLVEVASNRLMNGVIEIVTAGGTVVLTTA